MSTAAEDTTSRPSLGEMVGEISRDLSRLIRQELDLAKAELRQSANRAGRGAGMLVGAGVAGLMVLIFVSVAGWWALGHAIGNDWSALVVAAVWALIAVVLVMVGRSELNKVSGLPQTTDTVKKIPDAMKGNEETNS